MPGVRFCRLIRSDRHPRMRRIRSPWHSTQCGVAVSKGHTMNPLWHRIAWIGTVATGAGALLLGVAALPAAQAPRDEVSIAVFADHYVLADRSIDDLNVLETTLQAEPDRP